MSFGQGIKMAGNRLINDHQFECQNLAGKTVESCMGFTETGIENEVDVIILKVKELELYQRFFLDAAIGFWEELDYKSAIDDFEDLKKIDIGELYSLAGKRISSIICHGAIDTVSSIIFDIQGIKLKYRLSDENNFDSGAVLEKL